MSTYGNKYTDLNQNKLTLKTQIQRYLITKKDLRSVPEMRIQFCKVSNIAYEKAHYDEDHLKKHIEQE